MLQLDPSIQSQWLLYSAEWIPALFIILFAIILGEIPGTTRLILKKVCGSPLGEYERCVDILKQKTLLEFGALSFILAATREAAMDHPYMAGLAIMSGIVFGIVGYGWLTIHLARQFRWVTLPLWSFSYVTSLVAMTLTISIFGNELEGQATRVGVSLANAPLVCFLLLAAAALVVVSWLQMRKARRELPVPNVDEEKLPGKDAPAKVS